jgi:hypothetical protein
VTDIPIVPEGQGEPDIKLVMPWHFLPEIAERETDFLERGGTLAPVLPNLLRLRKDNKKTCLEHFHSLLGMPVEEPTSVV